LRNCRIVDRRSLWTGLMVKLAPKDMIEGEDLTKVNK